MCEFALMTPLASVGGRPPHGPRAPPHVGGHPEPGSFLCGGGHPGACQLSGRVEMHVYP